MVLSIVQIEKWVVLGQVDEASTIRYSGVWNVFPVRGWHCIIVGNVQIRASRLPFVSSNVIKSRLLYSPQAPSKGCPLPMCIRMATMVEVCDYGSRLQAYRRSIQ